MSAERLPAWGINTIGNWSDAAVCALQKSPYVTFLKASAPPIEGSTGYWGKFDDVFHPDFKDKLRQRRHRKQIAATKEDPWCIGYFVDNELSWGDETPLSLATLVRPQSRRRSKSSSPTSRRNTETIAALNAAWKTDHASWDALLASTEAPDSTPRGRPRSLRRKDRRHLFQRHPRGAERICAAPSLPRLPLLFRRGESARRESQRPALRCGELQWLCPRPLGQLPEMEKAGDKPYIIGEFHFGALDRGLFHTGIIPVEDQAERAQAFTDYVTDCLATRTSSAATGSNTPTPRPPAAYGTAKTTRSASPTICDTPYAELIEASRAIGEKLYEKRAGNEGAGRILLTFHR